MELVERLRALFGNNKNKITRRLTALYAWNNDKRSINRIHTYMYTSYGYNDISNM